MSIDCQNERPSAAPTNNVLITLTQNNLITLIERGEEATARKAVEMVFETASRHTIVPNLDTALRQTIEAHEVADRSLTTGDKIRALMNVLCWQLNLVRNELEKIRFVRWCVTRLLGISSYKHVEKAVANDKTVWRDPQPSEGA